VILFQNIRDGCKKVCRLHCTAGDIRLLAIARHLQFATFVIVFHPDNRCFDLQTLSYHILEFQALCLERSLPVFLATAHAKVITMTAFERSLFVDHAEALHSSEGLAHCYFFQKIACPWLERQGGGHSENSSISTDRSTFPPISGCRHLADLLLSIRIQESRSIDYSQKPEWHSWFIISILTRHCSQ